MEPKILMIGRTQKVIDILLTELRKFGRDVIGTDSKETVEDILRNQPTDLVVMGAGLPEQVREEMTAFIHSIKPGLPVHLIQRTKDGGPSKMIPFTNEKAVEFKIEKTLGNKASNLL
ncbi:MAG: hypothetical protein ACE5HO_12075 [bacterium]